MGKNGVTTTPVAMAPWGGRMRLSFEDSEAYAGILAHTVFSELQQQFNVKYSSNLVASTPPITATPEGGQGPSAPKNRRQKPPAKTPLSNDCTLRITVHGCKSQMQGVSKALSAVGFHFQHPYTTECRWGIEYWNPHYLLRPGGIMPKPQCPVDPEGGKQDGMTQADPLDEVETAEVMRIFDSAGRRDESIDTTQSPSLQSSLNPHQLVALSLMVERECGVAGTTKFPGLWTRTCDANGNLRYRHSITGSLELSPLPINGGILADEMGLGKTLTALALICASIDARSNSSPRDAHATLIVTPKSTIPEWKRQISKHIQPGHIRFVVYHGSVRSGQKNQLMEADIVLTTYETMRCKKDKKNDLLFSQTWRRVFLDEAHRICNASSITFQVARRLKAISRWCLTGTPIRNSLTDYFSLISFIRVPQFCEKSQFEFWIHSPIKKKQPQCFDALGDLIRATCIRRTKESCGLTLNLPSKTEVIEQVELDPDDQDLYNFFRDRTAKIAAGLSEDKTGQNRRVPGRKRGRNILTLINFLRRICNHGQEMLPPSALQSWREKDNNVDWGMMLLVGDSCEACGQCRQMPELQDEASPRADSKEPECLGCLSGVPSNGASKALQTTKGSKGTGAVAPSAKLRALLQNLRREQTPASIQTCQGKSVVFSIWTRMLDLVGEALSRDGLAFQRLDGQCTLQGREAAIKIFSDQPNCRVMLASIGSAGEGLNLIAGNHVHLLEPHWNPMAEIQALNRVHRMGQTREVTVRRYIVKDTIENYIQWVQQDKLKLISRSLDSADLSQEEFEGERWMRLQKMLKSSTDSDLALEMRKN
ncbi:SNF2 family N-terminal domain-containing protein [Ilyonectria destructans]|nr:SNF2 family N-terminal domain-containing protein [Ilyonectria destructans]